MVYALIQMPSPAFLVEFQARLMDVAFFNLIPSLSNSTIEWFKLDRQNLSFLGLALPPQYRDLGIWSHSTSFNLGNLFYIGACILVCLLLLLIQNLVNFVCKSKLKKKLKVMNSRRVWHSFHQFLLAAFVPVFICILLHLQ